WASPITVEDCVYAANTGNPVAAVVQLMIDLERGTHLTANLPTKLANYVVFHGLVAIACLLWAVTRLRAIALKQSYGKTQKRKVRRGWLWILRPRLGARPMLWKELFIESGLRFNVFMRVVLVLLIAGSFVP